MQYHSGSRFRAECNNHVFGPHSRDRVCPQCQHPRYNAKGQPNELCWYFPLREQLRALLRIRAYRKLLMYEQQHRRIRRASRSHYMCDIYDSSRWAKVAGPTGDRLTRVVLHACVDGCPAHGRKQAASVKPFQYFISVCTLKKIHTYAFLHEQFYKNNEPRF